MFVTFTICVPNTCLGVCILGNLSRKDYEKDRIKHFFFFYPVISQYFWIGSVLFSAVIDP